MSLQFDVDLDYFAEHCENFTGADFKALLYNAQLEVIHEITRREGNQDKFNYSPQKSPSYLRTRKRNSSYGLLSKAAELERENVTFKSDMIYMKNLTDGTVELTDELEDHLCQQVIYITIQLNLL